MKLFQQMLVAGASLSLLAPIAAQASDVVNFDEPSRIDSKTFTNGANQDISSLKALVEELQSKIEKLDRVSIAACIDLGFAL